MSERVAVETPVLRKNDEYAAENRRWFTERGIAVVNIMSAPGAGKTTLLEKTLPMFGERFRCAVIEGDLQTDLDAERIRRVGVRAHQINTTCCHLDARMVQGAAETFIDALPQVLFIENIGNLVCPASYDLGEHLKVTLFSVVEGADKPKKYPKMFRMSDCVVLNKADLLPYSGVALEELLANVHDVSPVAAVFTLSARTGEGLREWVDWLSGKIGEVRAGR
ncbi:MAG TPA: hydrogenase nickel incorporation protein HypB [Bryobacteraceae bacterium]|nr:hydrogenase nickel incorporation protein HypB [Bryobacteraceae bacterium]